MTGKPVWEDANAEYERIIAPIEERMMHAVWRITRDPDDAEEALQDALTRIWRRWDAVCAHPNPQALALRMCINAACDQLRRKIRRRKASQFLSRFASPPRTAPSPADSLNLSEQEEAIFAAIAKLSRNQAAAVTMRLVQNHSYEEIAQCLGCAGATARKHVERGRQRLRELLSPLQGTS